MPDPDFSHSRKLQKVANGVLQKITSGRKLESDGPPSRLRAEGAREPSRSVLEERQPILVHIQSQLRARLPQDYRYWERSSSQSLLLSERPVHHPSSASTEPRGASLGQGQETDGRRDPGPHQVGGEEERAAGGAPLGEQ